MPRDNEVATTAPCALRILWKERFFLKGKSQKEVEERLHVKGYNFGGATRKALERANFLFPSGKHGDKKFVQKHPYLEEKKQHA